MDNSKEDEIGFLIELVISGEADESQFEEVMTQVENDPGIASLYRQACAERELMGGEIAKEALEQSRTQVPEKSQEEIKRERRQNQNREL